MNTHLPVETFTPMALPWRIISSVLMVVFLVIGLAGLVLPVIPGALFLFMSALLATRVSPRMAALAHQVPWFRQYLQQWKIAGTGPMFKITMLLALKNGIKGLFVAWRMLRGRR